MVLSQTPHLRKTKESILNNSDTSRPNVGGKANGLAQLKTLGCNVPEWTVVPVSAFNIALNIPKTIIDQIADHFGEAHLEKTYAVRSSALEEDGAQFSFAGMFESFLHVPFDQIEEKIKAVWQSASSERVLTYKKEHRLPEKLGIAVVVQEMIAAEVSGVGFGIHPVSGNQGEKVISSVFGLGEGLVSGDLDGDTYTVSAGGIEKKIATQLHEYVLAGHGIGVERIQIEPERQVISSLSEGQIGEVAQLLKELDDALGGPQDIEFAYREKQLYILQTRPVTTTENSEYTLWDNSNIIESYPGITTPLTFSFIIKMYEQVYRQFVALLGVNKKEIEAYSQVFANTLGLVRGRVYYNLLSWYKMLAMVPGYSINAQFMENMMGVKERFELKESYGMNKGRAQLRTLLMIFKTIGIHIGLPKERKRFMAHLNRTMTTYKAIDFDALSPKEIIGHYRNFEQSLLLEWKAPLINDFFAMIWFGILQKQTTKLLPEEPNLHNDLLCGSADIISVQPIHRSIEIAQLVRNNAEALSLFSEELPAFVWEQLSTGRHSDVKRAIDQYLEDFGNRCVGELKLETISYSQKPALFVKVIQSYIRQEIGTKPLHSNMENALRQAAEKKANAVLKGKLLKRWFFHYVLKKARDLVSNRENLRYERTRGFGMVRTMFSALGKKLYHQGDLSNPNDIFYLELEEIKSLEHQAFDAQLSLKIEQRKTEFSEYRKQEIPKERFFSYGPNFTDEYIYSDEKLAPIEGDLKGIGCCPGRIKSRVQVIDHPDDIESLKGDILVTSSTDPGWVTLFPTASGIIVERGSLLSHSAIVSREMGIPCIVSVSGLLRTLKTGDEVLMDGSTGEIKLIEP